MLRLRRALPLFPVVVMLSACSAGDTPVVEPSSSATAETASPPVSATSAPSDVAPADAGARAALSAIHGNGGDAVQGGHVAAVELAKDVHQLPSPLAKTLDAIAKDGVTAAQKGELAGIVCAEPSEAATIEKLCGKTPSALMKELGKAAPAERATLLVATCKLSIAPAKDALPKLDARGVLAANLVAEALTARNAAPSEIELAGALPGAFPLDPAAKWH